MLLVENIGRKVESLTMPVHFPDCARLNVQMPCSNRLRDGKVGRVGDADLASTRVERLLVEHLVGELKLRLLISFAITWDLLLNGIRIRALEYVLFLVRNLSLIHI